MTDDTDDRHYSEDEIKAAKLAGKRTLRKVKPYLKEANRQELGEEVVELEKVVEYLSGGLRELKPGAQDIGTLMDQVTTWTEAGEGRLEEYRHYLNPNLKRPIDTDDDE